MFKVFRVWGLEFRVFRVTCAGASIGLGVYWVFR